MGISQEAIKDSLAWFESAKDDIAEERYNIALYSLEMSTEIALKAVLLSINVEVPKAHDIIDIVMKYAVDSKKLRRITEEKELFKETFADLLKDRSLAGYTFEYNITSEALKKKAEAYVPKVKRILEICSAVV